MEKLRRIVRLPRALSEQIRPIAQRAHRSLSAPIVHALAAAVAIDQGERSAEAGEKALSTAEESP